MKIYKVQLVNRDYSKVDGYLIKKITIWYTEAKTPKEAKNKIADRYKIPAENLTARKYIEK